MSADDVSATGASRSADLLQDIQQRYPTVYRRRQQRYARQQALNISKTVSDHELHVHFKDEKEDPRVDVASNPQTPRTPADCSRLNNLDDSDVVLDASNQRDIPYSGNTIKKTNLHPNQTESVFTGNAKKILDPLCSNSRDPHYRTKPIIGGECLSSANEYPDLQKANGLKYHHLPKSAAPRHSIQDRLQKNAEMLNSLLYRKPPFFSQRKHQQSPSAVDSPENGLGEKMSAYPCGENSLVCNGKHSTAPPSGSSSNTRISSKMSSLEQDYSSDPKDDENEDQVHKSKVNKSFTEMCQSLCEQQKCKSNICSPELCVSCMSAGYDSGVSKCTCSNLSAHLDSPCDSAIDVESTSIQSTVSLEKLSVQIPKTDLEGSDGPLPRFDGISHLPKMPDNQVKISTWQVEPVDFQWIQHNDCNGDGSRGRCFSEMNGRQVHTQRLGEISASDDTTSRYHADREFTDLSSSSLSSFQGSTVRDDLSIRSVSSMFTDSDICSNTPRSIYTPRSNISTSGGTPRRIAMKWRVQSAASKHVSVEDSGHSSEKELEEIFFLPGHRQATGYAFSTPRSYHLSDDCDDTDDTDPRCGITPGPLQRGHATAENTRQKKKHYIVKRPQSTPLFGSAESTSFDNRILDENQNNRSVFIAHSTESVPGALECLSESKCDNSRNYNTKCQTAMVPKKGNTNAHGERLTNQISFGSSQTDKGASQKSSEVADCYPATTKQDVSRLVEHGEDNEQVIKEGNRTHHLKADPFHADVGENDFSSARKRIQSFSYPCISSNLGFSRNSAKGSQCHPAQKRTQSLSCPSTPSHYQDLERSNCAGQISQLLFDLKNELIGHDTDAVSVQSEYSTTDDDNRGRESTGLEDDYVNIRRASDSEGERDPTACDQVERKSEDSDTACSAAVENSNCSIYIDVDSRTIEQTVTLKEPHSAAHSVTAVKKPVKKIRTIFKTSQSSVDSEESMKTMEDPYSEVENSNAPVTGGGVQNGTPPRVSLYATCEDVIPDHLSGNNNHTEDWNRTRGVQSYNGSQTSDIYENISDYCDGDTTMVKPGVIPKTVQDDSVAPPVASRRSVVYNCGENMTDPAYQKAEVEDDYAVVTKPRSGSALRVVDKPVVDKGDHCGVEGACGGEQDEDFCPPVPDRCYKKNSSIPLKASTEFGGSGSSLFDKVGCTFKSMKKAISMDRGMDHIGKEEKKRNKENKKERTDKLLMSKGPSLKSFTSFFSRKKPPRISSTGDACVDTAVQDPPSKDGKLKKCHKYLKRKSKPMPSKETVESPKEFRQLGKLIGINPDGSQLVELKKPPNGPIGFYIARGTANYDYGLLVSRFTTENPEKLFAGILGVGDEILEVNEKPVKDLTLEQVYELMAASDKLILKVFPLFARKDV
ncbi:uncharacterized protein LOC121384160 isoform X2 [Gigantopelta aegis]|uniref:uncharacterized protein LOC121384160 isoform X2 n=1 Tax=Gigantopelta aegis TaxID=1735272 RepID=UPI001B88BA85|nr:uncharacterized protein LOC121384160 isoform X2 [Gigantopelta aegis]